MTRRPCLHYTRGRASAYYSARHGDGQTQTRSAAGDVGPNHGFADGREPLFALRDFLGVGLEDAPPDHSTISRTRRSIDLETHRAVFTWVLQCLSTAGLVKGKTIGTKRSVGPLATE
jgi:hypothetical protein